MLWKKLKTSLIIAAAAFVFSGCVPIPQNHGFGNPKDLHIYQYADSIWTSFQFRFNLPDETPRNTEVRKQINWYMSNRTYLKKIAGFAW